MKKSISLTLLSLSLLACATPMQTQQNTPPTTGNGSVTQPPDTSPTSEDNSSQTTSEPNPNPTPTETPEPEEEKNRFTAQWLAMEPIKPFTTDISFVDFNTGWAVGRMGVIKKTEDAGKTWTDQSYGGVDIVNVSFVNKDIGFIATNKGMLYKTTNGGDTWAPIETPISNDVDFMRFFDENHGVIYGFGDNRNEFGLHITQDGGKTWKHVHPNTYSTSRFEFINPEKGLFISPGFPYAAVYKNDAFSKNILASSEKKIQSAAFKTPQEGYLFGSGFLLKTSDGGETWQNEAYITTQTTALRTDRTSIVGLSFANEDQGVMVIPDPKDSFRKVTLYTSNGGETWTEVSEKYLTKNQDNVYSILHFKLFDDFNHGWALLGNQNGIKVARLGSPETK